MPPPPSAKTPESPKAPAPKVSTSTWLDEAIFKHSVYWPRRSDVGYNGPPAGKRRVAFLRHGLGRPVLAGGGSKSAFGPLKVRPQGLRVCFAPTGPAGCALARDDCPCSPSRLLPSPNGKVPFYHPHGSCQNRVWFVVVVHRVPGQWMATRAASSTGRQHKGAHDTRRPSPSGQG